MDPILEGLVTTVDPGGGLHLAPMGPRMLDDGRILLRPFPTSQTFQNLKRHGEGVLHVTDDVLLLAKAALNEALTPHYRLAMCVRGFVLTDSCRALEFRVVSIDESQERVQIIAEIVHSQTLRNFFGFNRAKHAVLEAAILATRLHILSLDDVAAEYRKLHSIVEKTGGAREHEAFAYLQVHLDRIQLERSKT
jgi:hypothetical protein